MKKSMLLVFGVMTMTTLAACAGGCGASLGQIEQEVAAGDAVVAPLVGKVCSAAEAVDPSSQYVTVTCDVLDTAGNVIGQMTQKVPAATAKVLLAKHGKPAAAK